MKRWTIVIAVLAATALLVWIAALQTPDGRLHVIFLDTESGQGILVRTPSGHTIVIDGGPRPSVLLTALGRYLPFWQHTIDSIIATHRGTTALVPLTDVSRRYNVLAAVFPPTAAAPSAAFASWQRVLLDRHVPLTEAQTGTLLDMADGTLIRVSAASDGHLALEISYGELNVLLPGTQETVPDILNATIVAVPTSARAAPKLPLADSVAALILLSGKRGAAPASPPSAPNIDVWSTAVHGPLELVSDGSRYQIRPAR